MEAKTRMKMLEIENNFYGQVSTKNAEIYELIKENEALKQNHGEALKKQNELELEIQKIQEENRELKIQLGEEGRLKEGSYFAPSESNRDVEYKVAVDQQFTPTKGDN